VRIHPPTAATFFPHSGSKRDRLAAASDHELDAWALNVLDAPSLDAVFA